MVRPDLQIGAPTVAFVIPRTATVEPFQVETWPRGVRFAPVTGTRPESLPLPNMNVDDARVPIAALLAVPS